MDNRIERVVLETATDRVVGDLRLPREGYRSRFSEYLNRGDLDFIPLTNVEVTSLDGAAVSGREFVAVARAHIRYAYPHEGGDALQDGQ